ncbi:MAG: acyl-CoA dehydratase activase [Elusimicrobiota bacterium]|jgi:predicted CoA-substrate-specific enzyme activase
MRRLGVDVGSAYLGAVLLEEGVVLAAHHAEHRGTPADALEALLADPRFSRFDAAGVTASLETRQGLIDNSLALIEGVRFLLPGVRNVFEVGAQTFSLVFFDEKGRYREHSVNPPCAAGTGSFVEAQAERLGLTAARLSALAAGFDGKVPAIATRCAVFAKTDIIHAMQEGYSLHAVCAGLCDGLARSVVEALVKGRALEGPAGFVGGVSLNLRMAAAMERLLGTRVLVPKHAEVAAAAGAALLGGLREVDPRSVLGKGHGRRKVRPALEASLTDYPDWGAYAISRDSEVEVFREKGAPDGRAGIHLGVDIGSTSTKAVAVDGSGSIAGGFYTATRGEPLAAVRRLLDAARRSFGGELPPLLGVCATGSGRKMVKAVFRADLEVNEISAHAEAALSLYPEADTIIEIGGQDSKFTRLAGGDVLYAAMNYVCAAGTGSFIEEQAKKLGIGLAEFSDLALQAQAPYTSDRCTVYMERDLADLAAEGWPKAGLAAAVLNSVRDNYVAKVVGRSAIGDHVVFQGATARNKALVAAFESLLGRTVHVSPYCHLAGALGAALLSRKVLSGKAGLSRFSHSGELKVSSELCRSCANHCVLTVVDGADGRAGFGMKCGKDYSSSRMARSEPSAPERRFQEALSPLAPGRQALEGAGGSPLAGGGLAPRRQVRVGVLTALYGFEHEPLWASFLSGLGFSVERVPSTRRTLGLGRKLVNSDFCAPMILAHGNAAELLEKKADFVFCPAVLNERDEGEPVGVSFRKKTRDSYYCYYSQYLPTILEKLTTLDLKGRLIAPMVSFHDRTPVETAAELHRELRPLVPDLSREEVEAAYLKALAAFEAAKASLAGTFSRERSKEGVNVVLLGRPYLALDPALNLHLPRQLEAEGAKVFWQDEFDLEGFVPGYGAKHLERMHWHYGRTILKLADYAARTEGLFPVFLSGFRCSPDSFLINYVKDIMAHYGKPFLVLQLDELSSDVGYSTRIEAAMRSFSQALKRPQPPAACAPERLRDDRPEPGDTVLVSYLDGIISPFWADCFTAAGYKAVLLEPDEAALATGYRYASGGECLPLVAVAGAAINKVRSERLDPGRVFLYLPTICMACNFPQFPVFCRLAFDAAGLRGVKVGIINWLSANPHFSMRLQARIVHAYIAGCILHKLYNRVKPYETVPGAADAALAKAREGVSAAIRERQDLKASVAAAAELFRVVPRASGRKPRIAVVGDLYVKYNDLVNSRLQDLIRELGGEVVVSSITEYPLHFLDTDARLYGEDSRTYGLLRRTEAEFEEPARDLLGDMVEPDYAECAAALADYGIKHILAGETTINVGRVLYFLKKRMVDAVIHVNPMFCCPGVVTASIFRKIQEDFRVPVIDIFYDGTGQPNRNLIPHLHYLKGSCRSA